MSSVVVVGGGYAGTMVAKALDDEAEVTLIDPRDSFVNVSSSMRAAVRTDWSHRPFFRYRDLLVRGRFVCDSAASVDASGVVLAGGGRIDADYLVLATGSTHTHPARPRQLTTSAMQAAADLRATSEQIARADRVLILGAGPVGLELAGEIREAWPDTGVVVVDPTTELLPGLLPEVRDELHRQLAELRIDLRLGTALESPPAVPPGTASSFAVRTTDGHEIAADIWFRCFGARVNTGFLGDGALVELTARGTIPVDGHLRVKGHPHVYALGDIADLSDPKMATWAQTQALTVIENLRAQAKGQRPTAVHEPASTHRMLLTLGSRRGVGQMPSPDGEPVPVPVDVVVQRKGADLFTERFAARFTAEPPKPEPAGRSSAGGGRLGEV